MHMSIFAKKKKKHLKNKQKTFNKSGCQQLFGGPGESGKGKRQIFEPCEHITNFKCNLN